MVYLCESTAMITDVGGPCGGEAYEKVWSTIFASQNALKELQDVVVDAVPM